MAIVAWTRPPSCIHVRVVQNLDVVAQLGLKIRAVQRAHLGRSLVHTVAVSLAHCDDNVSLKETGMCAHSSSRELMWRSIDTIAVPPNAKLSCGRVK